MGSTRGTMTGLPKHWEMGWQEDWRIGASGTEVPYWQGGQWHLRVYNVVTGKTGVYNFSTDIIEEEEEGR